MKSASPPKRILTRTPSLIRWCSHCFLLIGALALGGCGAIWARSHVYQAYQSWRFDQMTRGQSASVAGFLLHWVQDVVGLSAHQPLTSLPGSKPTLKAGSLIGRMEMARIGLSAMVVEGDDEATLQMAIGHLPHTALPGQPGNVVIAGHRDTFFRALEQVQEKDIITLTTVSGTYQYQVESIEVVNLNDTHVLNAGDQPTLTLVTCYPFSYIGAAPKRFIVRARQVTGST